MTTWHRVTCDVSIMVTTFLRPKIVFAVTVWTRLKARLLGICVNNLYWPESGDGLLTGCLWCCCTAVWLRRAELVTCALLAGLGTGALVSSICRNLASMLLVYSAGGSSSSWLPGSPDRTTSRSYPATVRSDSAMPRASSSRGGVILRMGFRSGGALSPSYCLNLEMQYQN